MKASDLFVQCLESEGVTHIFGIPGEENLDFLESLSRSSIELVLTRHEQAAGFMAATVGRLTGKVGVALSTLGPGATNLMTAAAYAQLGGMPMLMITGQKPIKTSKQAMFQIIDVVDMMRPVTKWTRQIISGETLPARVREAFRLAAEERPGATHLELPEDIAAEEVGGAPIPPSSVRRPVVEDKSVDAALELLRAARAPLIVIGAGANRKLTATQLLEFVEKQGIPFITTQMGKGVIDERHPRFLGNAALSSGDFVHAALSHADLILNVGHDIVEKPPFFMERHHRRTVIHIDFSSAEVDALYFPQVEMVGDVAHSIWRLNGALERSSEWNFDPMFRARGAMLEEQYAAIESDAFPVIPQRLVADVRRAMPDDGIIALDNGIYKLWFARNYAAHGPNTVLLDNALATMGAGLPSAMAAKMVHPKRRVMAICGDGGFMMNSQELETATRLGLDLVVLILNDGALGMIKWKQEDMGFRDYGLDYGNPSFPKYAESYGAQGHRLSATDQLVPLLERCFEEGGVHLVDVPVDYSRNDELLHREIPRLSGAFVA
ncbi:Acetolactate synthase [Planctomycetes bacterium Poly30]|uniref:Acetolactate synthase n=1 Tax=Saltatorellus ferox TaxID=2528018 RepID=A0A518F1E5_9BACT|nr:Acetolactate synthase [Planctomycetes bacterium Poly30]